MFDPMTELFLGSYFLFDALAGKLIGNSTFLFDRLYDVFLLPVNRRAELYDLTQCEAVREIETYNDYAQICRIQKYSTLSGCDGMPRDIQEIVSVKGDALRKAKQLGFGKGGDLTAESVCKQINDTANMGLVVQL